MNDENLLRAKAREALGTGKLPVRRPERMWGGKGAGAACAVCDLPVRRDEIGFDLEFPGEAGSANAFSCALHMRCLAAWEFERVLSTPTRDGHGLHGASSDGTIDNRECIPEHGSREP
jgi:hypothetical protein